MVIGPGIKLTITIKASMKAVTPNTPRNPGLNKVKEREDCLLFPFVEVPIQSQVPNSCHFQPPDAGIETTELLMEWSSQLWS